MNSNLKSAFSSGKSDRYQIGSMYYLVAGQCRTLDQVKLTARLDGPDSVNRINKPPG